MRNGLSELCGKLSKLLLGYGFSVDAEGKQLNRSLIVAVMALGCKLQHNQNSMHSQHSYEEPTSPIFSIRLPGWPVGSQRDILFLDWSTEIATKYAELGQRKTA